MDERPEPLEPGSDRDGALGGSPAEGRAPEDAAADAPRDEAAEQAGPAPASEVPAPGAEGAAPAAPAAGRYVLQARFGALPVTGTATTTDASVPVSAVCMIRTARGTEMGVALTAARPVEGEVGETIGHVLRRATARDVERQRKIEDELEPEELRYCRQKIAERGLRMRLSGVEHVWGGERIVFHFTAERRVDFRALVRDLAWHFHTRIELRQIGARDEARLLADFEHCGRPLCCRTFLRTLEPVTMRMAKLQRTTLDPSKISGRCGRLMCCLRFEDAVYRELRKGLPQRGTRVAVGAEEGEVASTEILTQQVTVRFGDGRTVRSPVGELRPPGAAGAARAPAGEDEGAPSPGPDEREAPAPAAANGAKAGPGDARQGLSPPPSVRTRPARRHRRRGRKGSRPSGETGGKPGGGAGGPPAGGSRPRPPREC